jgi:hypothetical protein
MNVQLPKEYFEDNKGVIRRRVGNVMAKGQKYKQISTKHDTENQTRTHKIREISESIGCSCFTDDTHYVTVART